MAGFDIRDDALSAAVVNHEYWAAAIAQLESYQRLCADQFGRVEWLIVDNGSGVPPALPPALAAVRVDRSVNRGFGAACNRALALTRAPFVLLLNADLVPEPCFLRSVGEVVDQLAHEPNDRPRTGIVGFRLLNADGTPQGSAGAFPTLARVLTGLARPRSTRKYFPIHQPGPVPWVTGACLLLRRECADAIGGFDERYFMYYEDVDLCQRASRAGWQVRYDPRPAVRHLYPFHSRQLTHRLVYFTRQGLLRYFWLHRPRWEFRALGQIMLAECQWRGKDAGWTRIRDMIRQMLSEPDSVRLGEAELP